MTSKISFRAMTGDQLFTSNLKVFKKLCIENSFLGLGAVFLRLGEHAVVRLGMG